MHLDTWLSIHPYRQVLFTTHGTSYLARSLILQGHYQEAIAALEQARVLSPTSPSVDLGLGQVYLAQRNYDRAMESKTTKVRSSAIYAFRLSSAYAARGDKEKALATLQEAFTAGYRDFAAIDASPYFSGLRADPRFQQLVERYRK